VTIRPRALGRVPVVGKWIEPRWLRPTRGTPQGIVEVAKEEIRSARTAGNHAVVLNAMFHNVEIIPNGSPYAANEAEARGILDRLAALLDFAQREGVKVVGLSDLPEVLSKGAP
jgi:hypothetical protein